MFDDTCARGPARRAAFVPFDPARDYDEYIDGKQRFDGVRSFLASRGIELPEGHADDPQSETSAGSATARTSSSSA